MGIKGGAISQKLWWRFKCLVSKFNSEMFFSVKPCSIASNILSPLSPPSKPPSWHLNLLRNYLLGFSNLRLASFAIRYGVQS